MITENHTVAIIPARAGSKRIPNKNFKEFAGQPMISFAINAAMRSGVFKEVIVSTDSEECASIASDLGASVPFLRPSELSDDLTPTVPVIRHVIESLSKAGGAPGDVCCIYPCVPFLQSSELVASRELFKSTEQDFCFPVAEHASPIQRALKMEPSGVLTPMFNEFELTRTQDLEPTYFDAGQFYWGTAEAWRSTSRIHSNAIGYQIESWKAIDIDNPSDWIRAENLYKAINY